MDSQQSSLNKYSGLINSRRFRAIAIACLVLTVLVVLQAHNLKRHTPMCELLEQCNVSNDDLQRMQIALGQSGLSEFKVVDNRLMVPKSQHAAYLTAVAEHDAVPGEIRDNQDESPTINPFYSRTQQLAIARAQKKREIREMVTRLPFVEQAWFDMDKSDSRSSFQRAQQSAVISIRPPRKTTLTDTHVDTVKRMIGGAIAGLNLNEIVVIDLSEGFAHQDSTDPSATQQIRFSRIELEERRNYELRIREALKDYPGIEVTVQVDVLETPTEQNQVAALQPPKVHPSKLPAVSNASAGANGFVSLDSFKAEKPNLIAPPTPIALIAHSTPKHEIQKEISVLIDVPQKLVHDIFGKPTADNTGTKNRSDYQAALARDTQFKFGQLESEIVQKVTPLLPKLELADGSATHPIVVNLIRQQAAAPAALWPAQIRSLVSQNWPSIAVLAIGLILLSIVTRKTEPEPDVTNTEPDNDHVVLSMGSDNALENAQAAKGDANSPEVRLSKLIEKDPNAAARVIESWIRDAA